MKLVQFENLKAWHQRHWREQPVEKHVWDMVLTAPTSRCASACAPASCAATGRWR
jgi:hypothetical protein